MILHSVFLEVSDFGWVEVSTKSVPTRQRGHYRTLLCNVQYQYPPPSPPLLYFRAAFIAYTYTIHYYYYYCAIIAIMIYNFPHDSHDHDPLPLLQ